MSAQFAIGSVNRMAHIAGAGYGLGGKGFCVAGNKSLLAQQEDTSKQHRLVRMTVRLSFDRTFRNQQQISPFEIFFKNRQCHAQQSFSRFVHQNSNLPSGTNPLLSSSIVHYRDLSRGNTMSTLEQDLAQLNFEYLMLARECARNNPMEAAWRFGVERKKIEEIAGFSVENIRELSCIARTVITVIPMNTPKNVSLATHAALLTSAKANSQEAQ